MNSELKTAFPGVHPMTDNRGKIRWRYSRSGKTTYLQGEPGTELFQRCYQAALAGLPQPKRPPGPGVSAAPVTSTVPQSFRAAWRAYKRSAPAWGHLRDMTRRRQDDIAQEFLDERVVAADPATWGSIPVADLKRRHIKRLLASMSDRPHAARHRLGVIKKMIEQALDEEWIEADPTYGISYRPPMKGWRSWTDQERAAFERHWPIGTTPRLCYALALWLGPRRSDIVRLRIDQIDGDTIRFVQGKTGGMVHGHITPMLREVLNATDLTGGGTILKTAYGSPFSVKSLTGRMKDWTKAAGLPAGCVLHGLRKTLGKLVAESGGSTRQLMSTLGHDDMAQAELYSMDAERELMTRDAMTKLTEMMTRRAL